MADMIEKTLGAGLSGITGINGKTGKGIKSSLFGKLMVVLEQHGKITGKGKGILQLGKVGKQAMLFSKGDSLLAAKTKHLLELAKKAKHKGKSQIDDTAISLAAAHILIDTTIQRKKPDKSGKGIIALQAVPVKGEQMTVTGKSLLQTSGSNASSLTTIATPETGKASKLAQSKVIASAAVPMDATASKAVQTVLAERKLSAAASNNGLLSGKPASGTDQILQTAQQTAQQMSQGIARKIQKSVGMNAKAEGSGKSQAIAMNERGIINQQGKTVASAQNPLLGDGRKTNAADKSNVTLVKKSAKQTHVESAKVLAAIHLQGNKTVPQGQPTTAGPAVGIAIGSMVETSLAGSGSHSSGKGSQDGRYISGLITETRASGSAAPTQMQFQQYLSGKATPSMTVFDSMKHIAQSAVKGKTKLEIQLEPANLGKIQITLQSDAFKHLQVHMIVDQSGTRVAIEQQLPQLKNMLAQQGFDLSGFSMGSQGQQTFSGQNSRGQTHHFSNSSENKIQTSKAIEPRAISDTGLSIRI